jgi:protein-L-isoaspartate(D-aspartate) O-methyltransferase
MPSDDFSQQMDDQPPTQAPPPEASEAPEASDGWRAAWTPPTLPDDVGSADDGAAGEDEEDEATRLRERMVARLTASGALRDEAVERAMLRVPRHHFLPGHALAEAYDNVAITTTWERGAPVSSVSQPEIIAVMLQQLRVQPGMRALEVGAGSGYNAALLAELTGPTGSVVSLEIDAALAEAASERLRAAGYPLERARVIAGDGWRGWPSGAPFERIELTVGAMDLSPAWFAQLAEDGLLVAPLWLGATDVSVGLRKRAGALVSESWTLCGFVRLRGEGAGEAGVARLSDRLTLTGPNAQALAEPINALLATRARRIWWGQHNASFVQYLALASGRVLSLWQGNGHHRRRLRGRFLLYLDDADGPSMVIFPHRAPALLAFGGVAAERFVREQAETYRQRGAPPIEHWRMVARPLPAEQAEPPATAAPGVARLTTTHWVYEISAGDALTP